MKSVLVAGLFLMLLGILVAGGFVPVYLGVAYCTLSVMAYGLYAWDKRAALKGNRRISEKNLHWLALLGGWPGALCAQQHLRHKSQKISFKIGLWLTVLINLVLLVAYCWWYSRGF